MSEQIRELKNKIEEHKKKGLDLLSNANATHKNARALHKYLPVETVREIAELEQEAMNEIHQADTLRIQLIELQREEFRKSWDNLKDK